MNCRTLIGIIVLLIHLGLSGCGITTKKTVGLKVTHSCEFEMAGGESVTGDIRRDWDLNMDECRMKTQTEVEKDLD